MTVEERQTKYWKSIEVQLRQAADFLLEPDLFVLEERELEDYRNYADAGEFEQALDLLSELALTTGCKSGFWRRLKKPALQLGLGKKADKYESLFRKVLSENM